MVTDQQVRRLMMYTNQGETRSLAAAKSGMDEKTARRYVKLGQLPSELKKPRTWRTRQDPFEEVKEDITGYLESPGIEAKTIFFDLQRRYPGRFQEGQLRTLQRYVKTWRALEGPGKEVYFSQIHTPGKLSASDFTDMSGLGIRLGGVAFPHLVYHFVLTYSNWETGTICFSESFESLSEGFQNALWSLGKVPAEHLTDRLSAAVHNTGNPEEFTRDYQRLLSHYGLKGRKIQAGKSHENGDVEKSHHLFKNAVEQSLILRGSLDFSNREEYESFLRLLFQQRNSGRLERFKEEFKFLSALPIKRLDTTKEKKVRVGKNSAIRVQHNTYSVHSRLIGEWVEVQIHSDRLEVRYAQRLIETLPRLKGDNGHHIQYRHIIDWLVRKPGAFEEYRYRDDMFPTSRFRMAYDHLKVRCPDKAVKEYLQILNLAAKESESGVDDSLGYLLNQEEPITADAVKKIVLSSQHLPKATEIQIAPVNLLVYDALLHATEVAHD